MKYHVLTIFPDMISGALDDSILGKAIERGTIGLNLVDIRDYTKDKHRMVDDYPYGGGPGMVMKPEPILRAVNSLEIPDETPIVLLTPQGDTFDQTMAWEFSRCPEMVLLCGRYEGVDERVKEGLPVREISVGDFVLTGGEYAALIIIDAVSRLLPGVLGAEDSPLDESFAGGLLEYPQYTRPAEYEGLEVPEILLSGDHGRIERWRKEQSLERTFRKRPDLLENANLDDQDRQFLDQLKKETAKKNRG
jgi:tRNA (guanine37-N1)-methyltransferase